MSDSRKEELLNKLADAGLELFATKILKGRSIEVAVRETLYATGDAVYSSIENALTARRNANKEPQ